MFTSLELCAGAGGQALGLEMAGFEHQGLVELDPNCCNTLRLNRPHWNVIEQDLRNFDGRPYRGVDLLAGGLPCPPFSRASKQLGEKDERNLFPTALRLIDEVRPQAIMIENVRGLMDAVFEDYRQNLKTALKKLGYEADWRLLNASDYGVSQLRPRIIIVAMKKSLMERFEWPIPILKKPPTVGELLYDLMAAEGWKGARRWKERANDIAPTIVGGSKKHGGPDLGPTRSKQAWESLGVNGHLIATVPPPADFVGSPHLTVPMAALIQGFPAEWILSGTKTSMYRQVGNAFPAPLAKEIGMRIKTALAIKKLRIAA